MQGVRPPSDYARAEAGIAAVRRLPSQASLAREMRRIRRAEIFASTALAGSSLAPDEVDALLDVGRAHGNHSFNDYLLVRGYAAAADWIADARAYQAGDVRPVIDVDELRHLHARAAAGSSVRGGAWRQGNPMLAGGIVAPAAWLVAREVATLLDRFSRGPRDEAVAPWIARFLGRFARLLPFEGANGRIARLAANLMLRRLDVAPLVFELRDRTRYPAALAAAETADVRPLAALVATALVRTSNRLAAAAGADGETVVPLRELAGENYGALAKAAQRGRLRTVVRGGRYYTTAAWIAQYRASRRADPVRHGRNRPPSSAESG